MSKRVVASYCTTFLKPEMLHIYRQVRSLQDYETFVMTKALQNSDTLKIKFLAGRLFALTGATMRAQAMAAQLAASIPAEPQAMAKIIEGNIALTAGDPRRAITLLTEANTTLDTWIGRFDLGRADLAAGQLLQADSEFDRCITRQGEALSLFLDEEPTFGYFPAALYYKDIQSYIVNTTTQEVFPIETLTPNLSRCTLVSGDTYNCLFDINRTSQAAACFAAQRWVRAPSFSPHLLEEGHLCGELHHAPGRGLSRTRPHLRAY